MKKYLLSLLLLASSLLPGPQSFVAGSLVAEQAHAAVAPIAKQRFNLAATADLIWFDASDTSTMTMVGTRVDEWRAKNGLGVVIGTNATKVVTNSSVTNNPVRDATLFGGRGGLILPSGTTKILLTPTGSTFPLNWNTGWTALVVAKRSANNGFTMGYDLAGGSQVAILGTARSERVGFGVANNIPQGVPRNVSFVMGTTYAGGGSNVNFYRSIYDEKSYAQNPGGNQGGRNVAFDRLGLVQTGGTTNAFIGELAGYFFWPRVLTARELRDSVRWIKSYYGVPSPAQVPKFTIAIDGNSLANGEPTKYSNAMYDGALAANGGVTQEDVRYFSIGAYTTQQLTSRAVALIDPYYNEFPTISANRKIYMFWEGTNDLVLTASQTATGCYNNIKNHMIARKAAGWKTVVGTLLPRNTAVSGFETNRLLVNQMIRDAFANGETWIDAIADVGGDSNFGQTGQYSNTTYYNADGVHMNDAGYAAASVYWKNAINSITGL